MRPYVRFSFGGIVLSTALVAGLGSAQQTQPGPKLLNQIYPGPLGMADFGKIISGEFTGDLKLDAVVMNGSTPELVVAPETFDNANTVVPSANDVATLSGVLPNQDYILTVSSSGLMRHRRNSAASTWDPSLTIRGASTSWADAKLVAVGNLDGTGGPDIVGVAADARTVLIEYGNLDGTYTTGPSFQALGPGVTDLWLLNWREGAGFVPGGDEIALNDAGGVEVRHASTGQFLNGVVWTYSPILGTVISDRDTPIQRLALLTKVSGIDRLVAFGDAATEPSISIGAAGTVAMASGDADGDGDSDLFLSIDSANAFWKFTNRFPTTPTFSAGAKTVYPFGPSGRNPALNQAGLAPEDWFSHGKLSVLCPAQGDRNGQIEVYGSIDLIHVGAGTDPEQLRPRIDRVRFIDHQIGLDELEFRFIPPYSVLEAPAGATTWVGVKVYLTEELGDGTIPEPCVQGFIPMPSQPSNVSLFRFDVPENYDLETSTDMFSVVARQTVREDGTNYVLDIGPARTGIFTPEPGVAVVSNVPNTLQWMPTIVDPESNPGLGGLDIGPTVPSMDDDVEPKDEDVMPPP